VVANFNPFTWSNLEFPLARHNLGVCSRDIYASIKAALVMGISDSTTKSDIASDGAVVRTLRSRITIERPPIRLTVEPVLLLKDCVLLFDAEPGTLVFGLLMIEN